MNFTGRYTVLLSLALVLTVSLSGYLGYLSGRSNALSLRITTDIGEQPTPNVMHVRATITALAGTLTVLEATPTPVRTFMPFSKPTAVETAPPASPSPVPVATSVLTPTSLPPHLFPLIPADVASYAREHHTYPATDIFAPEGTEFVAVTDGIIEEVSRIDIWQSSNDTLCTRGGLSVSLVGDDGVRYYGSHLSAIAPGIEPGIRVAAGQLLGYVGNTGNARGVPSHLHFGISRPTGPGDCGVRRGEVWPYEYLNQWKRGANVVPELPE